MQNLLRPPKSVFAFISEIKALSEKMHLTKIISRKILHKNVSMLNFCTSNQKAAIQLLSKISDSEARHATVGYSALDMRDARSTFFSDNIL